MEGLDDAPRLMAELRAGTPGAAGKLVELFYPQLRRLAAARMRGETGLHTWQPTVMVNELYLELARIKSLPAAPAEMQAGRDEFFGLAAFLMRRLLARHARPKRKRPAGAAIGETFEPFANGEQRLLEIEDLLARLAAIDPALRSVVEMRIFEGLSHDEIAARLGCSERTARRHWEFAREWLRSALSEPPAASL